MGQPTKFLSTFSSLASYRIPKHISQPDYGLGHPTEFLSTFSSQASYRIPKYISQPDYGMWASTRIPQYI